VRFRLVLTAAIVVALFGALVVKLWVLQVEQGPRLNDQAQAATTREVPLAPPRGEILARGGQMLADNVATEEVTVDPSVVAANPGVVPALASLLNVGVVAMNTAITTSSHLTGPFVPVVVPSGPAGVTASDVTYIDEHPAIFPGVTVTPGYRRAYPQGALAAQFLGYLSELTPGSETGSSGLEAEYEKVLHGRPGAQQIYVSPGGVFVGDGTSTKAVPGDNVRLNMDLGLETTLTDALAAQLKALRAGSVTGTPEPAPWAAGIVLDNKGHVLAMTSLPSYDANALVLPRSNATYNAIANATGLPLNNYVTDGLQPPGSTFKLASATAALNAGLITPDTYVDDTGVFTLGNQKYTDADNEALGEVNVTSALAESSDYFFYNVGAKFWEENPKATPIQNTARAYGITEPSGIDLPGGTTPIGQVDSPALRIAQHAEDPKDFPYPTYFGGDSVDLAIGQGETVVTPLSMAEAYETFVNHGTRYAPEVAGAIITPTGKVHSIAPRVIGHVDLPESTWIPMNAGFEGAVQMPKGTAYGGFSGFNFSSWNVAGKTGTADVGTGNAIPPTAWFVGYGGPRSSATRYIVAIVVNKAGYGAQGSVPVARKVFNYLQAHGIAKISGS
jgi:penicillin-binding protein 2